jgi:predicted alpha/beta-hydrolase family hydrolase
LLLAHGAGAGSDSSFLDAAAAGLAARGQRVARFDFPYMTRSREEGRRLPPDRLPRLQEAMAAAARLCGVPLEQLVLAGKSMGGRVATHVADSLGVSAVVVFGYPFHPPGRPQRPRTDHLRSMATPSLFVQGERDPFGGKDEVTEYALPTQIQLCWMPDGDHSLAPRKRSGYTAEGNLALALDRTVSFLDGLGTDG